MVRGLLQEHGAHGYEAELVFLEDGPWPEQLRAEGVRADVIRAGRVRQPVAFAAAVARLARILRRRRPQLIFNWTAKTQLYGAPAALLCGMSDRLIWWQHAITPAEGHWLDVWATRLPARAIGYTSHAAAAAQERLRPVRPKVVMPAGTPPPVRPPGATPPLALPAGVPVIGLVARLQPWKGQDRLLRAVALLRERGHPVHLLLVGGDSFSLAPAYARSLPALVSELGLESAVTMTGEVPDAGPYIDQMDVLVNASDPEPFGIVLLEAMARGVAAVAVDAGGPREIIEDGVSGVGGPPPAPPRGGPLEQGIAAGRPHRPPQQHPARQPRKPPKNKNPHRATEK